MPTIMPIRDLRNTSEISELAHKKQEPIFITKNGYSDLVVMSAELYEKFAQINRIDQAIYEAEKEVEEGAEPISVDSAIERLKKNTMDKYSVMLYPRAFRDIDDIYAYIALEKMSPENAKGQTDRIWDAIKSLEQLPESHQDRLVGQFAGKGYKQLIVDNYIVIFKINKEQNRVYIVTVQYQGRNI